MKVSIAMATYNGEAYIGEQLESFLVQSRQPDELIVTDDLSTDATVRIVEAFAKSAPFEVKIYRNSANLGYARNFGRALSLASGDMVLLSDQDDVWFPSKVEYLMDLADRHPDRSLFMNDAQLTDKELNASQFTKIGQIKDLGLSEKSFVMGCCIAIRRELLQPLLPIPHAYPAAHDDWLVGIADLLNLRLIGDEVQQYYRIHDSNTSTFIANTLAPMKRSKPAKNSPLRRLSDWIGTSKMELLQRGIEEKEIRLEALGKLLATERYRAAVEEKMGAIAGRMASEKQRLEILQAKSLFGRAVAASRFYLQGNYRAFNGARTYLSDLLHR